MSGAAACKEINTHKSWLHTGYRIAGKQIENEAKRSLEDGGPLFCSPAPSPSPPLSLCPSSLLPSVRLSLLAHTMCALDCHLQSDPRDHDQPTLACTLHPTTHPAERTHTYTHTLLSYLNGEMHRPWLYVSQIFSVCMGCEMGGGGL